MGRSGLGGGSGQPDPPPPFNGGRGGNKNQLRRRGGGGGYHEEVNTPKKPNFKVPSEQRDCAAALGSGGSGSRRRLLASAGGMGSSDRRIGLISIVDSRSEVVARRERCSLSGEVYRVSSRSPRFCGNARRASLARISLQLLSSSFKRSAVQRNLLLEIAPLGMLRGARASVLRLCGRTITQITHVSKEGLEAHADLTREKPSPFCALELLEALGIPSLERTTQERRLADTRGIWAFQWHHCDLSQTQPRKAFEAGWPTNLQTANGPEPGLQVSLLYEPEGPKTWPREGTPPPLTGERGAGNFGDLERFGLCEAVSSFSASQLRELGGRRAARCSIFLFYPSYPVYKFFSLEIH